LEEGNCGLSPIIIAYCVLPKGFRRARNFGFLHPNSKRLIALLHLLLKFDPSRASRVRHNLA
jgi:hypothetical protein